MFVRAAILHCQKIPCHLQSDYTGTGQSTCLMLPESYCRSRQILLPKQSWMFSYLISWGVTFRTKPMLWNWNCMKMVRVKNFFWLYISNVHSWSLAAVLHQKQLQTQSLQKSKYSTESTDGGRKEETRRDNRDNKKKSERAGGWIKSQEEHVTKTKRRKEDRVVNGSGNACKMLERVEETWEENY